MNRLHEVVITGYGVVTPIGLTAADYWDSLKRGVSAIRETTVETEPPQRWYNSRIEGYDAKKYVQPRKSIKLCNEEIKVAFGSAMMACEMAGVHAGMMPPERLAVCFASEILLSQIHDMSHVIGLCSTGGEVDISKWAPLFMSNIYPLWMLMSLPNMAACHIGIALDSRGPNNTITTDDTSSLMAIHEADLLIQRGAADVVVVGTCGSRSNPTRLLQRFQEHYAVERVDNPNQAIRPFAEDRIGMGNGEGSGCVVLERADHAASRGARVYGKLCSIASTFSAPESLRRGSATAVANALSLALERAHISVHDVDHVNAGGSGSRTLDASLARGIANVLHQTPVVAVQGSMGYLGASTGICELVASIAAAHDAEHVPWTVHTDRVDPRLEIAVQVEPNRRMRCPYVAKISQTPHGQAAALVVKLLDN